MSSADRPTIMVSSTVYGIEPLLDQVFATLKGYGYQVWMSHKGTIPTHSRKSAFQNCLEAVEQCDAFLGIITGRYGSGIAAGDRSITHREILHAIELDKLRWFLVHRDVTVARELLKQFRFKKDGSLKLLRFKKTAILEDLRVLEMYEHVIRQDLPLSERTGNWAQQFVTHADALLYIQTQLSDVSRLKAMLASLEQEA